MARAKKRFVVRFKNDLGSNQLGTFTKRVKAEDEIEMLKVRDRNDISQGYQDLHTTYWIEEIVVY